MILTQELILDPPDFSARVYNNPKELYNEYLALIDKIEDAISRTRKVEANKLMEQINLNEDVLSLEAFEGNLKIRNDAVREVRRMRANLQKLLDDIIDIKRSNFDDVFLLRYDKNYYNYRETRSSWIYEFETEQDMLKCEHYKQETVTNIDAASENFQIPMFINFMRFHDIKLKSNELKLIKDSQYNGSRLIAETEDGKWLYMKVYKPL
jgi:hypothetical protein